MQRDFQARNCSGCPWPKKNYSRVIDQRLELLCNFHDSLSFFTHILEVYLCTLYCAFTPYTVSVRSSPSCFQVPIKKDLYWDCVSCLLASSFFYWAGKLKEAVQEMLIQRARGHGIPIPSSNNKRWQAAWGARSGFLKSSSGTIVWRCSQLELINASILVRKNILTTRRLHRQVSLPRTPVLVDPGSGGGIS